MGSVFARRAPADGLSAVEWAKRAVSLGAGEIVLNSIDADGTKAGFDLVITRRISESVGVPVVASGGAGQAGAYGGSVARRARRTQCLLRAFFISANTGLRGEAVSRGKGDFNSILKGSLATVFPFCNRAWRNSVRKKPDGAR
jgi:hypothetical protein